MRSEPRLWLIGAVSFGLRGGILALTLPMLVLPTQVEVRFALGDNLGSSGLTPGFWSLLATLTAVSFVSALCIVYLLARLELSAFDSLVPVRRSLRRPLLSKLFAVQATALLLALIAAVPLAVAIGDATLAEIIRPSSADSIYVRVLSLVVRPMLLWAVALLLIDSLSAVVTRSILASATRPHPKGGGAARALRYLATSVIGWLVTAAVLLPGAWLVNLAWQTARAGFLSGPAESVEQLVALAVMATLLAAVFSVVMLACGVASALRSSLWTVQSLR